MNNVHTRGWDYRTMEEDGEQGEQEGKRYCTMGRHGTASVYGYHGIILGFGSQDRDYECN